MDDYKLNLEKIVTFCNKRQCRRIELCLSGKHNHYKYHCKCCVSLDSVIVLDYMNANYSENLTCLTACERINLDTLFLFIKNAKKLRRLDLIDVEFQSLEMRQIIDYLSCDECPINGLSILDNSSWQRDVSRLTLDLLKRSTFVVLDIKCHTGSWDSVLSVGEVKTMIKRLERFKNIRILSLMHSAYATLPQDVQIQFVETITKMTNLESLSFDKSMIEDINFEALLLMPRLQSLHINLILDGSIRTLAPNNFYEIISLLNNHKTLRYTNLVDNPHIAESNVLLSGSLIKHIPRYLLVLNTRMYQSVRHLLVGIINGRIKKLNFPHEKTSFLTQIPKEYFLLIMKDVWKSRMDWKIWQPNRMKA